MAALISELRRSITDAERTAGVRDIMARRRFNAIAGGSAEGSTFHFLRKSRGTEKKFYEQLKKLSKCPTDGNLFELKRDYCGEIDSNCSRVNKKTGERTVEINKAYFQKNMRSRAEFLLWFESNQTEEREGRASRSGKPKKLKIEYDRMDGFMTAYIKGTGADRTFYIDLVCSKYGKGMALFKEAERIAKQAGCKTISLRAATTPLISLYRKRFGYERRANACKKYGRAERAALYEKGRRLDKSVPFVCSSVKDKDVCTKDKKAKKFCSWVEPRALKKIKKRRAHCRSKGGRNTIQMGAAEFDGRRMGTGDGWWMSKCLR
ncbi:MAG: hypothetical protein CL902_00680 [Dehalococcoidia bacterium]|nr:hypothetical protein [Dehalococcoidia bacterium]